MRYDPRRASPDDVELFRARDELLRLQAEHARAATAGQPPFVLPHAPSHTPSHSPAHGGSHGSAHTPVGTPAFGRASSVRVAPPRAGRELQSGRRRAVITIALVIGSFLAGFWYANALSDGAAMRQLETNDGLLPSS